MNLKVCIIGAGVTGLSSGVHLLESHRNMDVKIVSDKEFSQITSFGPPGIYRSFLPMKNKARETFNRMCEIYSGSEYCESGVQMISGHFLSNNKAWLEEQLSAIGDIAFNYRWIDEENLHVVDATHTNKYGLFYTTLTSEGSLYVPWLRKKFLALGGTMGKQKVETLSQISDKFDVIINCAGLQAGSLADDPNMYPVRGALLHVKAPWIKHFLFVHHGTDSYYTDIIPGVNTVFLGGCKEIGNTHLYITAEERFAILERSTRAMPSLRDCDIVNEWVGLRPYRNGGPRIELEKSAGNSIRTVPIIHNYGHGSNGFILSWGCANTVAQLLEQNHRSSSKL